MAHLSHAFDSNTNDSNPNDGIVVGLDIGTTKICAIVGKKSADNQYLTILGIGQCESDGLNRGVVVNIEKTVQSIRKAIQKAEQQSGIAIKEAIVGIAGDHIQSFQTTGIVSISNPHGEISRQDVNRLLDETRKLAMPADRKILHVIPQEFVIDGQDGITDPVGMSGIRMEAYVHVVTGLVTAAQNLYRCVERAGVKVRDLVLEPLASSYAVLDDAEREVGVMLVDIGGGTTDIAIFEGGIIRHTGVIGIAGKQVTEDIRRGLGIIAVEAERIKREYGHAMQHSIMNDEVFMIPGIGGRRPMEINKSMLCSIVQPRIEELFEFVLAEMKRSGYAYNLSAGIVLTGGGALLRGIEELAAEMFGLPVKIGIPNNISITGLAPEVENPKFATGVGLVNYGIAHGLWHERVTAFQEDVTPIQAQQQIESSPVEETPAEADNSAEQLPLNETLSSEEKQEEEKRTIFKKISSFFQEL